MTHRLFLPPFVMMLLFFTVVVIGSPSLLCAATDGCSTAPIPVPSVAGSYGITQCAEASGNGPYQEYDFTLKIVHCIEGIVIQTTEDIMMHIKDLVALPTTILLVIVVIIYGFQVATAERELLNRTMDLVIKLGIIAIFMNMLPDIVNFTFDTLIWLLELVTGGVSPWERIDAFLGNLLGFGDGITVMNGLLGLIGAAAFSSSVGVLMFFTGMMAIVNLLIFILSMIYTYLLSFIVIGFILVFAPAVIPLIAFKYTETYFRRWINIIIAAILTPVLLFALVWMFLGIFDILIENIFTILGGNDFKAYWRNNQPLFSWLMPADPNTTERLRTIADAGGCGSSGNIKPPNQLTSNPFAKGMVDSGFGKMATLDFGANDVHTVTELSIAMTTLWLFASFMKSMVRRVPSLAQSIARAYTGIQFGGGSAMIEKAQGMANKSHSEVKGALANGQQGLERAKNLSQQISGLVSRRKS